MGDFLRDEEDVCIADDVLVDQQDKVLLDKLVYGHDVVAASQDSTCTAQMDVKTLSSSLSLHTAALTQTSCLV